uniref:hypothetical protein n=1 Tax=Lentilactobacillus hilgardii TaxID=1588 RepID=UPI00403F9D97
MKFNELKEKVEALNQDVNGDYSVGRYHGAIMISSGVDGWFMYEISNSLIGVFRHFGRTLELPEHDRLALQKLAYKYSRTPLDERRDEPKFRVKMLPDDVYGYLNQSTDAKHLFVSNSDNLPMDKTIYTQSEYEQLQQKYPEWLPKFDDTDPHFEFLKEEK